MKKILVIFALAFAPNLWGQRAEVEKIFKEFSSHKAIEAQFSLGESDFKLTTEGKKFRVEGEGNTILYDGEWLYSFNAQSNEVVIEEMPQNNLLTNPTNIFNLDLNNFTTEEVTKSTLKLTPKEGSEGLESIILGLNDQKSLDYITIMAMDGMEVRLDFEKVDFLDKSNPKSFKFNKKEFPKAEIIDFRD